MHNLFFFLLHNYRPLKTKLDKKKEENVGNSGKLQMMQNESNSHSTAEETRVDSKGEVLDVKGVECATANNTYTVHCS